MTPTETGDSIAVFEVMSMAARRWKTIAGVVAVALSVGIVIAALRGPVYRVDAGVVMIGTRSRVVFEDRIRVDQAAETDTQKYGWFAERKRTIRQLIASPSVVHDVLAQARARGIPGAEKLRASDLLRSGSSVFSVRQDGDMFQIICRAQTPALAHFLASAIAETAVGYINGLYNENVALELLTRENAGAFESFRRSSEEYEKQIATSGRDAVAAELLAARDSLAFLYQSLTELDKRLVQAQGLRAQIAADGVSPSVGLYDALALMRFRASLFSTGVLPADLELKLDVSGGGIKPLGREEALATVDATIAAIEQQRTALQARVRDGETVARVGALAARLERIDRRTRELADARDVRWNTYSALERKVAEQRLLGGMQGYSLVKTAFVNELPEVPERRGQLYILTASLIFGLLFGFLIALYSAGRAYGEPRA